MMKHIAQIDPRRIPLLAAGLVMLVAAALLAYLILPQYKLHRAALSGQETLHHTVQAAEPVSAEHARLQTGVEQLELELRDDADGLPQQALEAFVIGRLQDISWRHQIELLAVQPSVGAQVGTIQETLFQLELAGGYAELHAWLRDLRGELDTVIVKQLSLAPVDGETSDPRLRAALVVAAYGSAE